MALQERFGISISTRQLNRVRGSLSGIYKNGLVFKGEDSPKKADYDRSSLSKATSSTLKRQHTAAINGQKTDHIIPHVGSQAFSEAVYKVPSRLAFCVVF